MAYAGGRVKRPKTAAQLLAETPVVERAKTLERTVYRPMPAAWVGTAANDNGAP